MTNADRRYQECRDSFNEHIDDCAICQRAVKSGQDFCDTGKDLSVELDSATVDAMAESNKRLIGGTSCVRPL